MRLATMDLQDWQEQAPFVDTLCLPIYELQFANKQLDIVRGREIERIASLVEKKLTGRLLLLPAMSYVFDKAYLARVIDKLQQSGFNYLLLLTDRDDIQMDNPVVSCFSVPTDGDTPLSEEEIEAQAEKCFQHVVDWWMNFSPAASNEQKA